MDGEVLNTVDNKIIVSVSAGIDTQLFIIEATSTPGVYAVEIKNTKGSRFLMWKIKKS